MSCTYADGLSPYENKGVLGVSEKFDSADAVKAKCSTLVEYMKESKYIVVHTGAGISTSAGIPDFRGPNGVWTLEEKGLKPSINISFADAKPTKTHMALKKMVDEGIVHYIVSQNIDGLHLKSGIERSVLAELHGNMFIDQCNFCKRQFVRSSPAPTVGQRTIGIQCHGGGTGRKPCRGKLHDTILDWEHSLPDDDLDLSDKNSCMADLSICLGTTLQINPSGNIPLSTLRYGGKLVICNLQPTKHDNKADLIINTYVDDVFEEIMKLLGLEIPEYDPKGDPVFISENEYVEWTVPKKLLIQAKAKFKKRCEGGIKKRALVKREYKIQQDELKIQSKKLKRMEKSIVVKKVKSQKVIKESKDDVIELNTSDEDDVILVNECDSSHIEDEDLNNSKTDMKTILSEPKVEIMSKSDLHFNSDAVCSSKNLLPDVTEPKSNGNGESIKTEYNLDSDAQKNKKENYIEDNIEDIAQKEQKVKLELSPEECKINVESASSKTVMTFENSLPIVISEVKTMDTDYHKSQDNAIEKSNVKDLSAQPKNNIDR